MTRRSIGRFEVPIARTTFEAVRNRISTGSKSLNSQHSSSKMKHSASHDLSAQTGRTIKNMPQSQKQFKTALDTSISGRFSDLHPTGRNLPIRVCEQWKNICRICVCTCERIGRLQRRDRRGFSPRSRLAMRKQNVFVPETVYRLVKSLWKVL